MCRENEEEMLRSRQEINTIKHNTDKNSIQRDILNLKLQENWEQARNIRKGIVFS